MLYTFDIRYYEEPHGCKVTATVYLDLPQNQLDEVKRNPFVIDLVNHPFIKNGIIDLTNHAPVLVDNIQPCVHSVPGNAYEVVCKYQEKASLWNYKTFYFKIYVDAPLGYFWPYSQLDFICGVDHDAFERLYQSGKYVVAPLIPNIIVGIADGYYYSVNLTATVEMVRITNAANSQQVIADVIDVKGALSPVSLNAFNSIMLEPIRLNDELLTMVGFNFQHGNIYGLIDVDYFEGVLSCQGTAKKQAFVKRENVGYSLIVEDSKTTAGCQLKRFFYLHEFQSLLWNEYKAKVMLTNEKLANICQYLNKVIIDSRIVAELQQVMDNFVIQNQGQQITNEMKVKYVAQYFNMMEKEAQHFVLTRYLWD